MISFSGGPRSDGAWDSSYRPKCSRIFLISFWEMGFLEVKARDPDSSADHSYWPSIFALLLCLQSEELRGVASQGGVLGGIAQLGVPERAHRLWMAEAKRVIAPEQ